MSGTIHPVTQQHHLAQHLNSQHHHYEKLTQSILHAILHMITTILLLTNLSQAQF